MHAGRVELLPVEGARLVGVVQQGLYPGEVEPVELGARHRLGGPVPERRVPASGRRHGGGCGQVVSRGTTRGGRRQATYCPDSILRPGRWQAKPRHGTPPGVTARKPPCPPRPEAHTLPGRFLAEALASADPLPTAQEHPDASPDPLPRGRRRASRRRRRLRIRPGRAAQGRPDAALHRHLCRAGQTIENGFKLYVQEQGGKLGGREIQYFKVDDESDPSKATDNVNKLIKRDNVDVLVGTVHSGVALAMAKAAKESNTLLIVPNAGADAITGPMCAPTSSAARSRTGSRAMPWASSRPSKGYKRAMTITWNYAAGQESVKGFTEAFEKGGGKVIKDLNLPFPNVEFQALLTEIAAQKPDVVFAFFAGGGAVKFVKDYDAAGLKRPPALGPGFLTDGTLEAQGASAQGLLTTLHYADNLDHAAQQRLSQGLRAGLQGPARRVRGAGLRRGADARRRPRRREGRLRQARRDDRRDAQGHDRQPARQVHDLAGRQPGAGHLPARGRGQEQRVQQRRREGAGRPGRGCKTADPRFAHTPAGRRPAARRRSAVSPELAACFNTRVDLRPFWSSA